MERCIEPNRKVWVEFKPRKMCEGCPPDWNRRRRGQSGRKGDRCETLSRPCWLEHQEYFRELGKFSLEDGVQAVLWGPHVRVGDSFENSCQA